MNNGIEKRDTQYTNNEKRTLDQMDVNSIYLNVQIHVTQQTATTIQPDIHLNETIKRR